MNRQKREEIDKGLTTRMKENAESMEEDASFHTRETQEMAITFRAFGP